MSVNVLLPGQERKIVQVHIPPHGDPKPCYADSLAIAREQGYVPYEPAAADAATPLIAPEETDADRNELRERAEEERAALVTGLLEEAGINRPPNPGCVVCGGTGLDATGATAPCQACYPEFVMPTIESDGEASTVVVVPEGIGSDNSGVIAGAPEGITVTTSTATAAPKPTSCTATNCKGLCGICPPPKKVTVREGRELNRNRRALGLKPLPIDGGKVGAEG